MPSELCKDIWMKLMVCAKFAMENPIIPWDRSGNFQLASKRNPALRIPSAIVRDIRKSEDLMNEAVTELTKRVDRRIGMFLFS